ncbi:hypothetical protein [Vibrio hepatarius]|uniref:hypothetical protein n=1 Tax=Vibrio hepatarius TaxID=171383 RepID=UPI001C09FD2F|nr:hypothetical protein [Vibrio hepatarius]MBU2896907.1 hypothetical protein [Vibrio hepatarius]
MLKFKNISIIIIGRLIQILVLVATLKLVTKFLTKEEVGIYYFYTGVVTLLIGLFITPIGTYFNRNIFKIKENMANGVAFLLLIRFLLILIAVAISWTIYILLDFKKYIEIKDFLILVTIALIGSNYITLTNSLNTLAKNVKFTITLSSIVVFGLIASVLSIYVNDFKAYYWLLGLYISQVLSIPIVIFLLVEQPINKFEKYLLKIDYLKIIKFITPLAFVSLVIWLQTTGYRYIVEDKFGVENLAYIALGLSISSSIFSAFESVLTQVFKPNFIKKISLDESPENRVKQWNIMLNNIMPIYIFLGVFIISNYELFPYFLLGSDYSSVGLYIVLGVFIEFFKVFKNHIGLIGHATYNTKSLIMPNIIPALSLIPITFFVDSEGMYQIPIYILLFLLISIFYIFKSIGKKFEIKLKIIPNLVILVSLLSVSSVIGVLFTDIITKIIISSFFYLLIFFLSVYRYKIIRF